MSDCGKPIYLPVWLNSLELRRFIDLLLDDINYISNLWDQIKYKNEKDWKEISLKIKEILMIMQKG